MEEDGVGKLEKMMMMTDGDDTHTIVNYTNSNKKMRLSCRLVFIALRLTLTFINVAFAIML